MLNRGGGLGCEYTLGPAGEEVDVGVSGGARGLALT